MNVMFLHLCLNLLLACYFEIPLQRTDKASEEGEKKKKEFNIAAFSHLGCKRRMHFTLGEQC